MHCPHVDWSASRLYMQYGVYLLGRLRARPELRAIADEFAVAQSSLHDLIERQRSAEEARILALAARAADLEDLKLAVQALGYAVSACALHDPRSPLYRSYFPHGVRGIVRAPIAERMRAVRSRVVMLENESQPRLRDHAAPLTRRVDSAQRAVESYAAAAGEFRCARAALAAGKLRWLDAYRAAHARLCIHHSSQPARAETYFRPLPRTARSSAGDGSE
jgi:hypothetical protein